MNLGVTELLIVLAIVVLLFGTRKLKNIGGDMGSAIRSFRSAVKEEPSQAGKDDGEPPSGSSTGGESGAGASGTGHAAGHTDDKPPGRV